MRILSFLQSRRFVSGRSVFTLLISGLLALASLPAAPASGQSSGAPSRATLAAEAPSVQNVVSIVSINSDRTESGNGQSRETAISSDGRFIAFTSMASNLVPTLTDTNNSSDVFLYDRLNNFTQLISSSQGANFTANGPSGISGSLGISADGRFVVYASQASDIVPLDNNGVSDIFLFDRANGSNRMVSTRHFVGTQGANGASIRPVISANGRFVAFTSLATDLSAINDTNGKSDVYVRNLDNNVTKLASVNVTGNNGGNDHSATSSAPSISDDGRFVAFDSSAGDLVANDTNGSGVFGTDVFVRDLQADVTILASVNSAGTGSGNLHSFASGVVISGNGRFVVFASIATNFVTGINDNNAALDIFRRDLVAGTTAMVSVNLAGDGSGSATANANSQFPSVSNDGRFVAFASGAGNLVATDTNNGLGGGIFDIFVRDMQTNTTELVSINNAGTDSGDSDSGGPPLIDSGGRYVLFQSAATNLTSLNDFDSNPDLFLRDLQTDSTTLITVNSFGEAVGIFPTNEYSLSSDGQVVAFDDDASDLFSNDNNSETDVFVYGPPPPGLSVSDAVVVEGDSGTTDAVFTVTLTDPPASGNVTVDAVTFNGSAVSTHDFQFVSSPLTFTPGQTTKTVSVPVIGDTVFEGDETFALELRNETGAAVVDRIGVGTIVENEQEPTLSVNDITIVEGDSGMKDATFTVSLSGLSSNAVSFGFGLTNGTALESEDFFGVGGGGLIAAGLTQRTITVPIIGDTITEPDETFFLNIANPSNATISDNQGIATIINDESASKPPTFQFSVTRPEVSEGGGSIVVEVTRSGDLSAPATVEYATSAPPNAASDRSDYTAAIGKLSYAAGESSKTFRIFITDDVFVEGPEVILVNLANPTGGASLGSPPSSFIKIIDNDTSPPTTNPVDAAQFFVRQHYIDFLNREPDAAGLAFWTNQITECQQPGATCDAAVRRINVSAAFFLSIEFQETGYFVYRTCKSSYGNITGTPVPVRLNEFLPDTQQIGKDVIVGQPGAEQQLENNKVAYALDFVTRSRFTTAYPTTLTPAEFVDMLFANAGVTPSATERNAAIGEFGGAGDTTDTAARARALRRVVENSTLKQQETNKAFVLMQYFGYLRRNPNDPPEANLDFGGYNFWLGKLNEFNGNFVNAEMVKAFLVSGEYRQRFGP